MFAIELVENNVDIYANMFAEDESARQATDSWSDGSMKKHFESVFSAS